MDLIADHISHRFGALEVLDRRSAHAERAIDDLRKRFGQAAVIRGIAYDGPEKPE